MGGHPAFPGPRSSVAARGGTVRTARRGPATRSASADAQLMALKQKMGILPAPAAADPKQLGAGKAAAEEIHDAEVEEVHDEKRGG